jgi:transposase InsO family protein
MKRPNSKSSEQVALIRFKAVNYVEDRIREGWRLADALRMAAQRPWPDERGRCYAERTIEDWHYAYKKGGFQALRNNPRCDRGRCRRIDADMGRWIIEQVCANPQIDINVLYQRWQRDMPRLPSLRTVYRYLRLHGYDRRTLRSGRLQSGPTKAFEAPHVNDLWMVDFSPGPRVKEDDTWIRTHLCVLIDDHSRLIPFAGYYRAANTEAFLHTLREGVLRRGVPLKLYTDRGKPFTNHHAQVVCANLGTRLLHAKPYHAWSKGKCERVIQTIQQGFESTVKLDGPCDLAELNRRLSVWIQTVYHQRVHRSTRMSPEARYQLAIESIRRLEADIDIDALFYTRIERTVRKDGTIRIDNRLYEVDLSLRALRVQVCFDPFTRRRVEIWYQEKLVCLAKVVNLSANSEWGGSHDYVEE